MATTPTNDLVLGLVKMLSRLLMVSRTLGSDLERNSTMVMAKLKVELNESSNSLKATLEAMGLLEDKLRQISTKVDNVKSKITALETDLQVKQTE